MTRTEVSQHFGNNKEAAQISRSLKRLADRGLAWMQTDDHEGKGRKAERWFATEGTKETKE